MDRSEVITLLSTAKTQDDFGVWRETETGRDVYCSVNSVTRSEFFDGSRTGLNPEFRITMFFGDYQDEKLLIYKEKTYAVYRTYYGKNDTVELYVERKGGANGKKESQTNQSGQSNSGNS